ncbi:MAG: GGDEF domain-containing protein, partial [Rhizobium oryzihabitans]
GHAAGDAVLKAVASRLRQRLSTVGEDAAAFGRIGGEEFAVVLAGKSAQKASLIAEELVDAVRGLNIATAGKTLAVTISAGSAVQRLPCNLDAVISQADAALYAAKTSGRDRALAAHDKVAVQDAAGRAAA